MYHSDLFHSACHDVKAICNASSLQEKGIHFFDYARMYDDGSCYLVSNNEKVIDYLFESDAPLFAPIPSDLLRDKFVYFIPEEGAYQKVMHDVKSHFNIAHGFDLFDVQKGYVDVYCFAGSAENNEMINHYFNNIDFLKNFVVDFKEKASGLLSALNNQRFQLSKQMQLNFNSGSILHANKKSILTKRQAECLSYLKRGMTIKKIAVATGLSPRTIEHYLDATKEKLSCSSRHELIAKAFQLGL